MTTPLIISYFSWLLFLSLVPKICLPSKFKIVFFVRPVFSFPPPFWRGGQGGEIFAKPLRIFFFGGGGDAIGRLHDRKENTQICDDDFFLVGVFSTRKYLYGHPLICNPDCATEYILAVRNIQLHLPLASPPPPPRFSATHNHIEFVQTDCCRRRAS